MAGLKIITQSNILPVTVTELKQTLRIDPDNFDQDAELSMMLKSSIKTLEEYTGRSFITKTYDLALDTIPYYQGDRLIEGFSTGAFMDNTANEIVFPKSPLVSVASFKYYNDSDVESTFASSNYYVDNHSEPPRLVLRRSQTFPDVASLRVANAFIIRFDAGYGAAAKDVPETIKQAINLYTSHLYENRELFIQQKQLPVPMTLGTLLQPYRVIRFGSKLG
ncbi:MAG: hypothetical protein CMF74_01720 [Maricaulis sp.]|jgi:uncharacterized phiE125 gp8 family phage protein|nr:hypothetical protein [Maricaulis sp.]|tara:strand:- start:238 stop:900 length:663 start_codon:yes stop_codon:yes gene_type:complete